VIGEKTLARLASWFVFLLANPEFHSHLASWRVVTRNPKDGYKQTELQRTFVTEGG
jgi:hypothetical protein